MKKIILMCSAIFILHCGNSSSAGGSGMTPTDVTITIPSLAAGKGSAAYGANPLHVELGAKVSWKNADSMTHTATSDPSAAASFDTGNISAGLTSSPIVFDKAGTYPYICTIHGSASMSGVIIVP